jgi:hypothetical protein
MSEVFGGGALLVAVTCRLISLEPGEIPFRGARRLTAAAEVRPAAANAPATRRGERRRHLALLRSFPAPNTSI